MPSTHMQILGYETTITAYVFFSKSSLFKVPKLLIQGGGIHAPLIAALCTPN